MICKNTGGHNAFFYNSKLSIIFLRKRNCQPVEDQLSFSNPGYSTSSTDMNTERRPFICRGVKYAKDQVLLTLVSQKFITLIAKLFDNSMEGSSPKS